MRSTSASRVRSTPSGAGTEMSFLARYTWTMLLPMFHAGLIAPAPDRPSMGPATTTVPATSTRTAADQVLPAAAAAELVAVAPRRHLRTLRIADAHELEPFLEPRETDLVGGHAQPGGAEGALALLDRLPALLERGEVPALALPAHDPEPALRRVEREPSPDREVLDRLVAAECAAAEQAGAVHVRPYERRARAVPGAGRTPTRRSPPSAAPSRRSPWPRRPRARSRRR